MGKSGGGSVSRKGDVTPKEPTLSKNGKRIGRPPGAGTAREGVTQRAFISPREVRAWTSDNAAGVPAVGYHAGTQAHIDRLMRDGIDVSRNLVGAYGRGFYMSTTHEPTQMYGPAEVRVAIHMRNPYVIHDEKVIDDFIASHPDLRGLPQHLVTARYPDLLSKDLLRRGYDGVILRSPDLADVGGDVIVAIKPGTVRVIRGGAAADRTRNTR